MVRLLCDFCLIIILLLFLSFSWNHLWKTVAVRALIATVLWLFSVTTLDALGCMGSREGVGYSASAQVKWHSFRGGPNSCWEDDSGIDGYRFKLNSDYSFIHNKHFGNYCIVQDSMPDYGIKICVSYDLNSQNYLCILRTLREELGNGGWRRRARFGENTNVYLIHDECTE